MISEATSFFFSWEINSLSWSEIVWISSNAGRINEADDITAVTLG